MPISNQGWIEIFNKAQRLSKAVKSYFDKCNCLITE